MNLSMLTTIEFATWFAAIAAICLLLDSAMRKRHCLRLAVMLCFAVMLPLGLGACAGSLTKPSPQASQDIAGTCLAIAAAERGFDIAEKAGKVSRANYDRVQGWIGLKKPVCNVSPEPATVSDALYAALLQIGPVFTRAAAGNDVAPAPPAPQ